MSDPNYNPGFFGWMWDGVTHPLQALNTFENNTLAPAANAIGDFLSPVTTPLNSFLTGNPVGQAVAPVLQTGAGYSSDGGAHVGMAAPTGPTKPLDVDSIVNNAVSTYQPGISSTHATVSPSPSAPAPMVPAPSQGSLGVTGGGWSSATNAEPLPKASRLSDGTEYRTKIVNGQTVYDIVASPKNPSAVGKTVDDANFSNILNGRSFTPWTAPAPVAATPPAQMTSGTPSQGGLDPNAVATGASAVLGAGGAIASGNAQADAAEKAAQIQKDTTDAILKQQQAQFQTQQDNLKPWLTAGGDALKSLGTFFTDNPDFSMANFQQDPGYQFRLDQGMKALQNSAAARGGLLSGNTMKGITDYSQGMASQEYNDAFNRYNQNRGMKLNNLQSLAGIGQTAVGQANSSSQNYSNGMSDAMMTGGNALASGVRGAADGRASGYMGATNALTNALSTGMNTYNSNKYLNMLLGG